MLAAHIPKTSKLPAQAQSQPKATKAPPPQKKRAPSVESESSHFTSDSAAGDADGHGDDHEGVHKDDDESGLSGMPEAELYELMTREVSLYCSDIASHLTGLQGRQH